MAFSLLASSLSHLNWSYRRYFLALKFFQIEHDLEMIVKSKRDYVLIATSGSGIYLHLVDPGNWSFCWSMLLLFHVMICGVWIELDLSMIFAETEREVREKKKKKKEEEEGVERRTRSRRRKRRRRWRKRRRRGDGDEGRRRWREIDRGTKGGREKGKKYSKLY